MNRLGYTLSDSSIRQHTRAQVSNYLWLLLICLLAYWPLTGGVFSVKNDAIHYFLPYRFNISEAIRNGEFPFWSPYIYNGYPVYGDMQSGAWNPVVWLFSCIGRYDLTLFHYENLLYIFLGSVGMYKLATRLTSHKKAALLTAVAYMLSGFMLSGQLINWLAAAAFIPFVVHYFTLLLKSPAYNTAIKTAVSLYLLFTAGYPSFFIVTLYLLLLLFLFSDFSKKELKKKLLATGLLIVVFSLLSLPAFLSYLELLPYYQRGQGLPYPDAVINSFDWHQLRSFLFPSTIHAADIPSATDLSFRNMYIGLLPLALIICYPPAFTKRTLLLSTAVLFALLYSLGNTTPVHKFCYDYLPLMNTFRHPAQVRLFLIIALLLLSAPALKELLDAAEKGQELTRFRYALGVLFILTIATITLVMPQSMYSLNRFTSISSVTAFVKDWVNYTTLSYTILINGIIQMLFIAAFFVWTIRRNQYFFFILWISNFFIMAQLLLPVSFVSSYSPNATNRFIHQQPNGFPVTGCDSSLAYNSQDAYADFDQMSLRNFYNKKPGISQVSNSPSFLNSAETFLQNRPLYAYVAGKPLAYLADSIQPGNRDYYSLSADSCAFATGVTTWSGGPCTKNKSVRVTSLSSNKITFETITGQSAFLILAQQFHHNWSVKVDGKTAAVSQVNIRFMGVEIPPGKHTVRFSFSSRNVSLALWPMAATLLVLLIYGCWQMAGKLRNQTP